MSASILVGYATRYGSTQKELLKFPWFAPVAIEIFGGKFDPTKLRFPYNLIPALKQMPACDIRDYCKSGVLWPPLAVKTPPIRELPIT